ncbi:MAG: hypothetical protein ACI8VW_004135, partial [bacterium]
MKVDRDGINAISSTTITIKNTHGPTLLAILR